MLMKSYIRTKIFKHIRPLLLKTECEVCGETKELELHHVRSFSDLFSECHNKLDMTLRKSKEDYTDTETENIVNWMLGVHLKIQCLTLCKNCHIQLHEDNGGFIYSDGYKQWVIKNRLVAEKKRQQYIQNIIIPYLDTIIDKKLYKEDRKKLIKIIQYKSKDNRLRKSATQLNKYFKSNQIQYIIKIPKRKSYRDNQGNVKKEKTCWIVSKIN